MFWVTLPSRNRLNVPAFAGIVKTEKVASRTAAVSPGNPGRENTPIVPVLFSHQPGKTYGCREANRLRKQLRGTHEVAVCTAKETLRLRFCFPASPETFTICLPRSDVYYYRKSIFLQLFTHTLSTCEAVGNIIELTYYETDCVVTCNL
mgnify:CR=1 FL=1